MKQKSNHLANSEKILMTVKMFSTLFAKKAN